jgi:hypothetical protein
VSARRSMELSTDGTHRHIQGVCTISGTHYSRKEVVDGINRGEDWHTHPGRRQDGQNQADDLLPSQCLPGHPVHHHCARPHHREQPGEPAWVLNSSLAPEEAVGRSLPVSGAHQDASRKEFAMATEQKEREQKPDKKVTLTISTLSGDYTDDFPEHQKLKVVIERTIEKLGLQGEGPWILEKDDAPLDPEQTIEQAGLKDGDVLTLNPAEGGGGSERL